MTWPTPLSAFKTKILALLHGNRDRSISRKDAKAPKEKTIPSLAFLASLREQIIFSSCSRGELLVHTNPGRTPKKRGVKTDSPFWLCDFRSIYHWYLQVIEPSTQSPPLPGSTDVVLRTPRFRAAVPVRFDAL